MLVHVFGGELLPTFLTAAHASWLLKSVTAQQLHFETGLESNGLDLTRKFLSDLIILRLRCIYDKVLTLGHLETFNVALYPVKLQFGMMRSRASPVGSVVS